MNIKLILSPPPDNKAWLLVEDGTVEQAKAAIAQIIERLLAKGIEFTEVGVPEQHRHDAEGNHVESGVTA